MSNDMEEAIERMERFFNNETMLSSTLHGNGGKFKELGTLLFENIGDLSAGKKVKEGNGVSIQRITENLDLVKHYVLFEPISKDMVGFFKDWVAVLFNWNNNITKDDEFAAKCSQVEMFIDGRLTMDETIGLLRTIGERMNNLRSWNPPAFEVSKSFLNYLDED